jgi:8-oxo-dGTP diphosphatase
MEAIEVGCAIIHKNGKLLIAQRHLQDSFGGYWEFPGGKREQGEAIEACLVREALEELGIRILPERLLRTTRFAAESPTSPVGECRTTR